MLATSTPRGAQIPKTPHIYARPPSQAWRISASDSLNWPSNSMVWPPAIPSSEISRWCRQRDEALRVPGGHEDLRRIVDTHDAVARRMQDEQRFLQRADVPGGIVA